MKYRSDIDGLRALAVAPVVLYHAGVPFFSGGFVGVDVFFVLSGYLITHIILDEIKNGRFSIIDFYERRIRRIFPALFVVIMASITAAWFLFLPDEFKMFGKSVSATLLFLSNMLFWKESGYFDASALEKPLLHTWSLSVEEQFYVLYPLLLFVAYRYFHPQWKYIIATVVLSSFAGSAWLMVNHVDMAFYWAPLRAWELLLGGGVALGMLKALPSGKSKLREVLSTSGIMMILYAVFFYSDETVFPGVSALLPCVGAVLIIYAGISGTSITSRFLTLKPIVFVGLVSYSLYLWHWPIIVFFKAYFMNDYDVNHSFVSIFLSLLLAVLSWKYVEQPFRKRNRFLRHHIFFGSFAFAVLIGLAGCSITYQNGYPSRVSEYVASVAAFKYSMNPNRKECFGDKNNPISVDKACVIGESDNEPSIYLMGDSHADSLYGGMHALEQKYGVNTLYGADASCPPLLGLGTSVACELSNHKKLSYIQEHANIDSVVLAARWSAYIFGRKLPFGNAEDDRNLAQFVDNSGYIYQKISEDERNAFASSLKSMVAALLKNGKKVILVYPIPEVGTNVPAFLAKRQWLHSDLSGVELKTSVDYYEERHAFIISMLDDLLRLSGVSALRPTDTLCDEQYCYVTDDTGLPWYRDSNHLSLYGSSKLMPLIAQAVHIKDFSQQGVYK